MTGKQQTKTMTRVRKRWQKLSQEWKELCEKHGLDDVLLLGFDELYDVAGAAREYRSVGFNFLYYKKRVPLENVLLTRAHGVPKQFEDPGFSPVYCYPYGRLGALIAFAWQHLTLEGLSNTPFDDAHMLFSAIVKELEGMELPVRVRKNMKRLQSLLSNSQYSLASYEFFVKHVIPSQLSQVSKFVIYWKDAFIDSYYTEFISHLLGDGVLIALNWLNLELSVDEHLKLIINLRDTLPISSWKEQVRKGMSNDELTSLLKTIVRAAYTFLRGDSFTKTRDKELTRILENERLFNGYLFNASKLPLYFQKSLHVTIFDVMTDGDGDGMFVEERPILLLSPYEINQLETEVIAKFLEKNKEYFNQATMYRMQYYAGPFDHVDQLS